MSSRSIMLVGGPDSGKTNYLARVWKALHSGTGRLQYVSSSDIEYVEHALSHLLSGKFAPRSDKDLVVNRKDFCVTVSERGTKHHFDLIIPDVTGELWRDAVQDSELPPQWMEQLRASSGAILFVRVHSELNVMPLDWVTAREILKLPAGSQPKEEDKIPTQVVLCELLRFLQLSLKRENGNRKPRVAIVVTAWDRADAEAREAGPLYFIERDYPFLAGKIEDLDELDISVFGASVVGGDLNDDPVFKAAYLAGDIDTAGYVTYLEDGRAIQDPDLTTPLAWAAGD